MTVDRQAKAEAKRKQKGLACAKALAKASASLNEYLQACNDCNDASSSRGADDGRLLLMSSINEYERYLSSIYER